MALQQYRSDSALVIMMLCAVISLLKPPPKKDSDPAQNKMPTSLTPSAPVQQSGVAIS